MQDFSAVTTDNSCVPEAQLRIIEILHVSTVIMVSRFRVAAKATLSVGHDHFSNISKQIHE